MRPESIDPNLLAWYRSIAGKPPPKYHVTVERKAGVTAYHFTPKGPEPMTLNNGVIKSNCPACLEPSVLLLVNLTKAATRIVCNGCGLKIYVPAGPNPSQAVALEIIGANDLGETQAGDRRLIVHEGEALDVTELDALDPPPIPKKREDGQGLTIRKLGERLADDLEHQVFEGELPQLGSESPPGVWYTYRGSNLITGAYYSEDDATAHAERTGDGYGLLKIQGMPVKP